MCVDERGGRLERVWQNGVLKTVKQRSVLPLVVVVESRMAWTCFSDVGAVDDGVGRLNFIFAVRVLVKKLQVRNAKIPP